MQRHLHRGYHEACQELIETAAARWQEEEGDYRDDVRNCSVFYCNALLLRFTVFTNRGGPFAFLKRHNSLPLLLYFYFVQITAIVVKFPLPYNMG